MTEAIEAYHFFGDTLRRGMPVPPNGKWLVHDGPVKMCESGLHGSRHPFDALYYAPGPHLAMTLHRGLVIEDKDKLVSSERMIVRRINATKLLREYACRCALDVAHMWNAPPVVLAYLRGEDRSTATRDAARGAAWAAARGEGWGAPQGAAWAAALGAELNAARGAGWAAARGAAWGKYREPFAEMVNEAFA